MSVLVSPNLEPIAFAYENTCLLTQEEHHIFWLGFQEMWFNFPLPFKRGDILVRRSGIYCDERRFALNQDATLDPTRDNDAKILRLRKEHSDHRDILVRGHAVDEKSDVIQFCYGFSGLLSLEPFDGELEGFERKLEPLSRFSRGEIDFKRCLQECEELHAQVCEELEAERRKAQLKEVRRMFETQSDELCHTVLPPELLNLLG